MILQRLLMVLILCSICTFVHASKPVFSAPSLSEQDPDVPLVTGVVLDDALLAQGGDITLGYFKAGDQAEASDELDSLSDEIQKGIKERIDANKGALHVITPDKDHQPKLVLEGYIQEYSKTSKLQRMMFHPNKRKLSVQGEIWLVSNGQRIMEFAVEDKFDPKKRKPSLEAHLLGKAIGDFVNSHSK